MARVLAWMQRQPHPLWRAISALYDRLDGKLGASAFSRNVSVMLIGTVLGQATSVLLAPILTRLYSPAQFGSLSVYTSALTILIVAASLGYEIPMSTARSPRELVNFMALSFAAVIFTTGLLATAAFLIPVSSLADVGLAELDHYRLLFPIGYFVLGCYFILLYAATWAQEFDGISRTRISQGISGPISQIVMGLLGFGAGGLALGFVIGQSAGTTLLFNRMVVRRWAMLKQISFREIRSVAWRNRNFPLVSSWAGMIDASGSGYLAYILVASLYSGPLAGFMFLAERVVARPLQMISTSMLTVFMGEIGRTMVDDPAHLRRRFLQVTSRQLMAGAAWVVLIDIFAAVLFPAVFGAEWSAAVPYVIVMSIAYLANSVISAVAHTLQALRRQFLAAIWQLGRVLVVSLVFYLAHRADLAPIYTIGLYAAVQVVANVIMFFMMKTSIEQLIPQGAEAVSARD